MGNTHRSYRTEYLAYVRKNKPATTSDLRYLWAGIVEIFKLYVLHISADFEKYEKRR